MLPETDAMEKLKVARLSLISKQPFLGTIAARLELKEADSTGSLATDGETQFYNRSFVRARREEELVFGLANNALHVAFDHLGRKGDRDHRIWNLATDIVICAVLLEMGFDPPVEDAIYDTRFTSNHTSEEVYDAIKDECDRGLIYYCKNGQSTPTDEYEDNLTELGLGEILEELSLIRDADKPEYETKYDPEEVERLRQNANTMVDSLRNDPALGNHIPKSKG